MILHINIILPATTGSSTPYSYAHDYRYYYYCYDRTAATLELILLRTAVLQVHYDTTLEVLFVRVRAIRTAVLLWTSFCCTATLCGRYSTQQILVNLYEQFSRRYLSYSNGTDSSTAALTGCTTEGVYDTNREPLDDFTINFKPMAYGTLQASGPLIEDDSRPTCLGMRRNTHTHRGYVHAYDIVRTYCCTYQVYTRAS